jgi:CRISPR-associated protein Cas4
MYGRFDESLYQQKPQIEGKAAHAAIDEGRYSTRKNILQGTEIYTDKYKLCGKIDLFNISTGVLTERKKEVKTIYDGYIFQVYAQYFALTEMGYKVKSIVIYCLTHNRSHVMYLPTENKELLQKFEDLVEDMNNFKINNPAFMPNKAKCERCIYANLCDHSLC